MKKLSRILVIILPMLCTLGLFQNFEIADLSDTLDCRQLKTKVNTTTNAGPLLQKCLNSLPSGATLLLPPGIYNIAGQIHFQKPVTLGTQGLAFGMKSPRCQLEDVKRCATFQYAYSHLPDVKEASYTLMSSNIHIDHVIFSGARASKERVEFCASSSGRKPHGGTIRVLGSDISVFGSVLKNAPCYTAMEVVGSVQRLKFVSNLVANNGTHSQNDLWSDGLTVHDGVGHIVTDNLFNDNTDVDLIFGGCQGCTISRNKIKHSSSREGSTFAALLIYAWAKTSGNYTGTSVSDNSIDCGSNKRCGYGLGIGGKP